MSTEKLQKILAGLGYGSRREMEVWIAAGRVKLNGQLAKLGERADFSDVLEVDGRRVKRGQTQPDTRVLIYHKPAGEICSRKDPQGRPTVFDQLPRLAHGRWVSIGRLDLNTSGLLIFTNNGVLANQLMHPRSAYEREYAVRILGELTPTMAEQMVKGVKLEDGFARFEHIVSSGGSGVNQWYHLVVMEGRNRLVRRMFEHFGFGVSRLMRVRFGPIFLPRDLRTGEMRALDDKLIRMLQPQTK